MNAHVSPTNGSANLCANHVFAAKKGGRPAVPDPASERSRKPWLSEHVSARTYYRRKAAAASERPPLPQQQSAHVVAWIATLGPIERLDYRSMVRRCVRALARQRSDIPVFEHYMHALGAN